MLNANRDRQTRVQHTMLAVEHEAAEVLRHMRLNAHAAQRAGQYSLRWLFELLGWRVSDENRTALRAGRG